MTQQSPPPTTLPTRIGYCTNVHAGVDLQLAKGNLQRFSVPIRRSLIQSGHLQQGDLLGVGLWLAEPAAGELVVAGQAERFRDFLAEHGLMPFTFNGFPQGDFHQAVVKHRVYRPEWFDNARRGYTLQLIEVLDRLLPEGEVGSISTLPIGWGTPHPSDEQLRKAAKNLVAIADELHKRYQMSGRKIVLAIEPEPGCVIDTVDDMISFFENYIDAAAGGNSPVRQYLTVCHDVCHSAVMAESQEEVLNRYRTAGIGIGKVQVSSALAVHWDRLSTTQREEAVQRLNSFAEDRYLHQTGVCDGQGKLVRLIEDLPQAIREIDRLDSLNGSWHIHFHVPIFVDSIEPLSTTQGDISPVVQTLSQPDGACDFTGHYEIETYAWSVLPSGVAHADLSEGIAEEFRWFQKLLS